MNLLEVNTHKEISYLYFPSDNLQISSRRLTRYIRTDIDLWEDLLKAGFRPRQRIYTPLQVEVLIKHLGTPQEWHNSRKPLCG